MGTIKIDNINKFKMTLEDDGVIGFTFKAKIDQLYLNRLVTMKQGHDSLFVEFGSNQMPLPMIDQMEFPEGGIGQGEEPTPVTYYCAECGHTATTDAPPDKPCPKCGTITWNTEKTVQP